MLIVTSNLECKTKLKRTWVSNVLTGFTPCKAEQPLRGMELQEIEATKITTYRKSV